MMFIVISEFPDFDQTFLKFMMKSGCVSMYSNSFRATVIVATYLQKKIRL